MKIKCLCREVRYNLMALNIKQKRKTQRHGCEKGKWKVPTQHPWIPWNLAEITKKLTHWEFFILYQCKPKDLDFNFIPPQIKLTLDFFFISTSFMWSGHIYIYIYIYQIIHRTIQFFFSSIHLFFYIYLFTLIYSPLFITTIFFLFFIHCVSIFLLM